MADFTNRNADETKQFILTFDENGGSPEYTKIEDANGVDRTAEVVELLGINDKEDADSTILKEVDVEDSLNSTSTTKPLSANQGKQLNDDKASLSSANTFQEKQTLNKDAEIHSLTVGRGSGEVDSNTAVGVDSLENNTTGPLNTAVGRSTLENNTEGDQNTAVGQVSLLGNTTGGRNTAVGRGSLLGNTTGRNNIAIGRNAGRSSSPFEVTTQDNRIVMGNNVHTDAYIRIGWTVTSDKRDKTNFAEVPYGLDFVKELKPTKYQFREERGSEYTDGKDRYGFLAQDILELEGDEPVIIDNEDPENLKFKESHLVPVLVNAIQELTKEVETLKEKINE